MTEKFENFNNHFSSRFRKLQVPTCNKINIIINLNIILCSFLIEDYRGRYRFNEIYSRLSQDCQPRNRDSASDLGVFVFMSKCSCSKLKRI